MRSAIPDGNIEYIGRINQVKIRGFRPKRLGKNYRSGLFRLMNHIATTKNL